MRVWGFIAAACLGVAGAASAFPPRDYFPGLTISDNPSAAEQRAFVEAIYKGWDVSVKLGSNDAVCSDLDKEIRAGRVTYLEPEAFGRTEKPAAVKDIEKRCPYLHLGLRWDTRKDDSWQEKPEEEMTSIYGEPFRATENFALYRIRLPNARARTVFVSDRACRGGKCSYGTHFTYIDEEMCLPESGSTLFPYRYDSGAKGGPALLWTVVRIKDQAYFLEAGNLSDVPGSDTWGGPGLDFYLIPPDVVPDRPNVGWTCSFYTPKTPR